MATLRLQGSSEGAALRVAPLIAGLAAAATVELLILRTFTRTAVHIPALEAMQEPYGVLAFIGRYAYFLSLALLMLALPALALAQLRDSRRGRYAAIGGIGLFILAAALGGAGLLGRTALDLATLAAVVTLMAVAAGRGSVRAALPLSMLGLAFVANGGYTLLQSVSQESGRAIDAAWLLTAGEVTGVLFALAMPLVAGKQIDRWSLAVGASIAVLAFGMFAGAGGSTSRILLLWNEGLSGTLPGTVYAVAAGTLTVAFVALLRSSHYLAAMALVLLVAGGLGLHNTYQSGLVIAGLAVLAVATPGSRVARE